MIRSNIIYLFYGIEKSDIYNMSSIPDWIDNCINITNTYNKQSNISLISNVKYEHPEIHSINIDEQQSLDLSDFKDDYVHLSTNHVHMERLCFERWFILRNYMRKHDITRAIFLDVDVVCVQDLSEDFSTLEKYSATLSSGSSPHTNFVSLECLESFCSFVSKIYTDKSCNYWTTMNELFNNMKYGGICDMTLWKWYATNYDNKVLTSIQTHNIGFDHSLRDTTGWDSKEVGWGTGTTEVKNLVANNGKVTCYNTSLNKHINFKTIHYQGGPSKYWLKNTDIELLKGPKNYYMFS